MDFMDFEKLMPHSEKLATLHKKEEAERASWTAPSGPLIIRRETIDTKSHGAKTSFESVCWKSHIVFRPLVIEAGGHGCLSVEPQVTFRPRRLVLPSKLPAAWFQEAPSTALLIQDIRIGKNSCLPCPNPISGSFFRPLPSSLAEEEKRTFEQHLLSFDFGTVEVGQLMTILLFNGFVEAVRVEGVTIFGEASS